MAVGAQTSHARAHGAGRASGPQAAQSPLVSTRLAVAAITSASCFVGMLPGALFLAGGRYAWIAFVAIAGLLIYASWQTHPTHTTRPDALEVGAAALATISQGAIASLIALSMYLLARGAHWLVNWTLSWFGSQLPFSSHGTGTVFGLVVGLIGSLAIVPIATKFVWRALFPPVAGFPTPYRTFTRTVLGQVIVIGGLVVAALFVVVAFTTPLWRTNFGVAIFTTYALALTTIYLWDMGSKVVETRTFTSAEEAIGSLLTAMDLVIAKQPRSGLPAYDPFLAALDYAVANKTGRTFAVIVQPVKDLRVECVSRLLSGAHALSAVAKEKDGDGEALDVEPVLVLVGPGSESAVEEVTHVAQHLGVLVIRIPVEEALQPAVRTESALKTTALSLLGALLEPAPARATQDSSPPHAESASSHGATA